MTELRFSETAKKLKMDRLLIEKGTVIVGFSGGADSSCLLRLMRDWGVENGVRVVAAHVNHMIRGEEADRDEEFCRESAAHLGVEFYSTRADVPALAKESGRGIEETARDVRYAFFDELSEKLTGSSDGAVIATAHNASDNLETVLMNLMRGSGLHGMSGIAPIRDGRVIRPLICDSGEAIRSWCAENDVKYVVDSTNAETDCTRNAVRHKIVPIMRELCASPEASVTRMTSLLRTDDEYLENIARSYAGEGTSVDRETLVSLDPAVAARVLIALYNNAKQSDSTLTEKQTAEIIRLSNEKSGYSEVSLSGNIKAVIERDRVSLVNETETGEKTDGIVFEYDGGEAVFENGLYRLTFSDKPFDARLDRENNAKKENIYNLSTLRAFDSAKIKGHVKIRYKTDGDSYVFCGHTHKLKKLFTDKKLTEREKKLTPILCDDDGIFWVAGFGTRDGVKLETGSGIYLMCEIASDDKK